MAILLMIYRKMVNNRWLIGSLLLGLLITVGLVSSIPAYTAGMLQRLIVKDLEEYQKEVGYYPGGLYQSLQFDEVTPANKERFERFASNRQERQSDLISMPIVADVTVMSTPQLDFVPQDAKRFNRKEMGPMARLTSLSDLEEHIVLTDGAMPSKEPVDGVLEALVPELALEKRKMVLGTVLVFHAEIGGKERAYLVKPVGTFQAKQEHDPYWFNTADQYAYSFLLPEAVFREQFLQPEHYLLSTVSYFTAYNYNEVKLQDVDRLQLVDKRLTDTALQTGIKKSEYNSRFSMEDRLAKFKQTELQLKAILWSLHVPVLVMLAFYLFMVSRMIVSRQQTEIAVLGSRGAGRWQIMLIYLLEVSILAAAALLLGPLLGLGLCRILGASNGFLEFVQRKALPVELSGEMYLYALWTAVACIVMMMIPVYTATRESIIARKQKMARAVQSAVWHKLFLDVLLLAAAWYGWHTYQRRVKELTVTQADLQSLQFDPLLFFVPAVFILGLGLFCLRIFPLLIRTVYWLGRRFWPPAVYATLIQVGRSSRQYQFLMIFLVMTIAVGVFSSSAARTINANLEEQIRYASGSDIRLKVQWEDDQPDLTVHRNPNSPESNPYYFSAEPVALYKEPSFDTFVQLPGVEQAAKVFVKDETMVEAEGRNVTSVKLMAIDSKQFGETAWFKPNLMPHHWYQYLNLLANEPSAVLVSKSLADKLGLRLGQYVFAGFKDSDVGEFVVYGIIDYWPSWSPLKAKGEQEEPLLLVANLPYVQNKLRLEPYEVWLKMKPEATSAALYEAIREKQIPVLELHDTRQQLIQLKTGAFLLGLNGALTLGFLISIIVTLFGFLLFWVLTLGSRKLQYGIFRAMGISLRQLIGMMGIEQLLTSGVACLLGMAVGGVTIRLFVPSLEVYFGAGRQVPPFQVVSEPMDEMRLYLFVLLMLLLGVGILTWLLSRIKIYQAVKLGED